MIPHDSRILRRLPPVSHIARLVEETRTRTRNGAQIVSRFYIEHAHNVALSQLSQRIARVQAPIERSGP